jgi:hypothetical protein
MLMVWVGGGLVGGKRSVVVGSSSGCELLRWDDVQLLVSCSSTYTF